MNTRLKKIRTSLKLNQEQFCKPINISRSHLSALESGRKNLTNRIIDDVCVKYNVNKEWLENGIGEMFLSDPLDIIEADEEVKEFLDLYMSVDEETREYIKGLMKKTISNLKND